MTTDEAKSGITGMSGAGKHEMLKWMIDGMTDTEQRAFQSNYYSVTGKQVEFIDAVDTVSLTYKVKKLQPSTGA